MFYSLADSDDKKHKTMFKLICRKIDGQEKVVGCHLLGRGVDEMIQTVSVAVTMGATKQDFDNSVAVHPTAAEELVTMNGNLLF
jgi:glutathione reductase (NADPH)